MYMIWQVIVMKGQPIPLASPSFLVLSGEVSTAAATVARVVATALVLAVSMTPPLSGHFYICRTEC